MKIAIQGHPTRGKEVAQILESFGGENLANHSFKYNDLVYYLSSNNFIACALVLPHGYRKYTIEEFEKEFPFKVGDKVITLYGSVGIIRALIPDNNKLPYCVETEKGYIYGHQSELKSYKEMERNITLTLDKAKEWYKKGGELREIALQAFTEKELNPLPRSWEEFCKQGNPIASWRYSIPTKYEALYQLEQLRNCWWNGWEPEWGISQKWCIRLFNGVPSVGITTNVSKFLTFPTREMAEEFLECFKDLIKKAGDLI